MLMIALNQALCVLMGSAKETAHQELGRQIRDQNLLRVQIRNCFDGLRDNRRLRWILRVASPGRRPVPLKSDNHAPLFWPPADVVAWIERVKKPRPASFDDLKTLAGELARKWENHDRQRTLAFERLCDAARAGQIKLFYCDGGMRKPAFIRKEMLSGVLSTTDDRLCLTVLQVPSGPSSRVFSKSYPRRIFHNVEAIEDEVRALIASPKIRRGSMAEPRAATGPRLNLQPSDAKLQIWYKEYRRRIGRTRPSEADQVQALKGAFPNIIDSRGRLRSLKKVAGSTPQRGRPRQS